MKINLNTKILNANFDAPMLNLDKPVRDGKGAVTGHEDMTLRDVLRGACIVPIEQESPDSKWNRYLMLKKLHRARKKAETDFTVEELSAFKKYVGLTQPSPVASGQARELLDGKKPSFNDEDK